MAADQQHGTPDTCRRVYKAEDDGRLYVNV